MRFSYWWRSVVSIFLLGLAASAVGAPALAPTPEQIQAFSQLPPAQRDLVRRALAEEAVSKKSKSEEPRETEEELPPKIEPVTAAPPKEVRLKGGDTVLLDFRPQGKISADDRQKSKSESPPQSSEQEKSEQVTPEERALLQQRRQEQEQLRQARLPKDRVFVLDQFGALTLTNIGRIPLAGLTELEAGERLTAETAFEGLRVRVKRLPLEGELKRFGHDLFVQPSRTFTPATDIPIPADYIVGPGDVVMVQLYGKDNVEHELTVTRDGALLFPGIGPITVAGMKFSQLQKELQNRVQRQFIGARASVTLGRLRSIRIFILGEVEKPGSYPVSSLSTLTNALFMGGGVTPAGSLRDIQLKRNGEVITHLDLYDLLLRGDTRGDARLLPGDVIFVPPVGPVVGVGGRVRRPAIYELRDEKTLREVIAMAGGLLPDAYPQSVQIERVWEGRARSAMTADMTQPGGAEFGVQDGDTVRISAITERFEQSVRLAGWVARPGVYQWKPEMRLVDLIPSLAALRADADSRYVVIKRENPRERTAELLGGDLGKALSQPASEANIALLPNDEIHVFGLHEDRATLLKPMLERVRVTSSPTSPTREVVVEGAVHHPGRYPWSPTMTVEDLINAAGGLTERAYAVEAELTRSRIIEGKSREQTRQVVSLASAERSDARVALQPYDQLVVRRIPQWDEEGVVELVGEVRFPGRYPIIRGEKLSHVIQRAGGLTEAAYARASVFLRQSVREREQQYLERLTAQLERDLGVLKTEAPELGVKKEAALMEGEALLRQMRATKATGRMVIKLEEIMQASNDYDVMVQPGDKLIIPQRPDEVTVIGETYYPTSHVYVSGYTRDQYVRLSGGITERGNKRAVYVVHADGSVSPPSGWFGRDVDVGPGDTIIVPLKVDRVSNLKLFTDISTVLYQLAVTAAALDVIGVF